MFDLFIYDPFDREWFSPPDVAYNTYEDADAVIKEMRKHYSGLISYAIQKRRNSDV